MITEVYARNYANVTPELLDHFARELRDECFEHAEVTEFILPGNKRRTAICVVIDQSGEKFFCVFPSDPMHQQILLYHQGETPPSHIREEEVAHVIAAVLDSEFAKLPFKK